MIAVFGPAVEEPVCVGDFAGAAFDANGAGVAHPAAISGDAEEIDGGEVYAGLFQDVAHTRFRGAILDEQIDALDTREVTNDFCVGPGDGGEFAGPVRLFVRPPEPGGFMMLPLGGHPATTFEWVGTARGLGQTAYWPT